MILGELIQHLGLRAHGAIDLGATIAGLTEDSRRVAPGWVFVARPGLQSDGRRFIAAAIGAGAAAVITDQPPEGLPASSPLLLAHDPSVAGAQLAERLAGSPSRSLRVVGVTGTNGKTTVATLVYQISRLAGVPCGLIGTVEIDDGTGPRPSDFTTPPAERLSPLLAAMRSNGCVAAAMEVSSHSLDQRRAAGLRFAAAIFTNLTGDHLDYHGDMERYAHAKSRLFEQLEPEAIAVLNADDPWSPAMAAPCAAPIVWCSLGRPQAGAPAARATIHEADASGMAIELAGPWGLLRTRTALIGAHNAMNLLQALVVCTEGLGVPRDQLGAIVPELRAPTGRLEPVHGPGDDVAVLVDFAHSDDALASALRAARLATPAGARLWAVFGCGGDKDRTKRPRMGAAAASLADRVIVTSDNPRTEDPEAIIDEVFRGIAGAPPGVVRRQADRREAIREALHAAAPGDVVVIAGKGHEREQILPDGRGGTRRIPFDDHAVARAALDERRADAPLACAARRGTA
ncbi:MAG TPA: UDP-N-acetylmuramoyl-L-alanyl-D-glutamate--2,6-diaminopimelate ligase [Phycisphaerales bacterium]|nr:UDP-N-acetylmuramoyl-L-alanyl-D-glutamate--2,6-diaminopimelate ligase [Phycisphaerales bacterium]